MEKEYYIVVNENREGPFSLQQLAERGIEPSTLVWTAGLADWTRADAIPELGALLQNQIADNESAFGGYARQEEPVRPPYKQNDQYGPYNNYGQPNNMPQATATNWKTLSIIATVCGFIFSCIGGIVGIFAIVQAGKAENAMRCGDSFTAANCWSTCKTLCIISFVLTGLGLIANVFYISQLQKLGYGFL
ncbi:MAG: GYF domain-containing protein [Muribaculaceae bacterium]|nr:GYF domain-containing protein [Muribaculaceae bacterium]